MAQAPKYPVEEGEELGPGATRGGCKIRQPSAKSLGRYGNQREERR